MTIRLTIKPVKQTIGRDISREYKFKNWELLINPRFDYLSLNSIRTNSSGNMGEGTQKIRLAASIRRSQN